jgi:hypothetical protein
MANPRNQGSSIEVVDAMARRHIKKTKKNCDEMHFKTGIKILRA